MLRCF